MNTVAIKIKIYKIKKERIILNYKLEFPVRTLIRMHTKENLFKICKKYKFTTPFNIKQLFC